MFQEYKENCKIKNKIINFPKKQNKKDYDLVTYLLS